MFLYSHSKFKDSCYRDLNYHLTFSNIFYSKSIYIYIFTYDELNTELKLENLNCRTNNLKSLIISDIFCNFIILQF